MEKSLEFKKPTCLVSLKTNSKPVSAQVHTAVDFNINHSLDLETDKFQLGDELLAYDASNPHQNDANLYLICAGRVRVLCRRPSQSREITASVLGVGETYGADHLLRGTILSYRVIAATPCQIARIPLSRLISLLAQLSQLKKQLLSQVQQREYLIFFKTLTQLQSCSYRQLQGLTTQIVEQQIEAGTFLTQVSDHASQIWLRNGQIQSRGDSQPPTVGDSWGPLEPNLNDWVAQTDLLLYRLPLDIWTTARLLNLL